MSNENTFKTIVSYTHSNVLKNTIDKFHEKKKKHSYK